MSRVTKLTPQKWSFFENNDLFLDIGMMRVLRPPVSMLTGPGHFMGILASIFRVSNAAVVASGPWELKVLDGSGIVSHVVPTPSATRGQP